MIERLLGLIYKPKTKKAPWNMNLEQVKIYRGGRTARYVFPTNQELQCQANVKDFTLNLWFELSCSKGYTKPLIQIPPENFPDIMEAMATVLRAKNPTHDFPAIMEAMAAVLRAKNSR